MTPAAQIATDAAIMVVMVDAAHPVLLVEKEMVIVIMTQNVLEILNVDLITASRKLDLFPLDMIAVNDH